MQRGAHTHGSRDSRSHRRQGDRGLSWQLPRSAAVFAVSQPSGQRYLQTGPTLPKTPTLRSHSANAEAYFKDPELTAGPAEGRPHPTAVGALSVPAAPRLGAGCRREPLFPRTNAGRCLTKRTAGRAGRAAGGDARGPIDTR